MDNLRGTGVYWKPVWNVLEAFDHPYSAKTKGYQLSRTRSRRELINVEQNVDSGRLMGCAMRKRLDTGSGSKEVYRDGICVAMLQECYKGQVEPNNSARIWSFSQESFTPQVLTCRPASAFFFKAISKTT